jgi:hypothetical protein
MATTAEHLTLVIHHWPDLHEALGGRSAPAWPPAGRMSDYLRALDQADTEQLEAERHRALAQRTLERDPAQIGERPIPIRLPIHETMRIVQAALVECADQTAEYVQRQPINPPPPRRAAYAHTRAERLAWNDHARRVEAAQQDRMDPRRWSWTGPRPGAVKAALWLLGRVQGAPGPFRPLAAPQAAHIAAVARGCALRVEDALDVGERRATLTRPCPDCGGRLHLHGGAGALPVARCTACGHVWGGQSAAA